MTDELRHRPPDPLRHLSAVAEVTRRSQQIALAALHEALTQPVCPERVAQLRRVTDDLHREVRRLEEAIDESDDAPIVRVDDPPVVLVDVAALEAVGGTVKKLAADLAEELPCTGEDAAGLGVELAEAGDVEGLRRLRDLLLAESNDPRTNGPALDVLLYGPKR
jgi:hypothetical protein